MTYMDFITDQNAGYIASDGTKGTESRPLLLVMEDELQLLTALQCICDHLEIAVEHVPSEHDLGRLLKESNPVGVAAAFDCRGQDGCHVMMTVARHDRSLPMMLITGADPGLLGAADAVQEIWRLSSVFLWPTLPAAGEIASFLCYATRHHSNGLLKIASTDRFVRTRSMVR
jgi:hypothetical protein